MRTEKRRIVLLGATGYTGQRVLRELLARGEEPTLVGRSRSKMLALADGFEADLPVVEVDVTSTAAMTRVLDSNDVVLSTVGPFMQLGIATITAAAQAGAHYLDSTGEGSFVRRAFEMDSVAAARGATIVPAFGYDYVPGNLAGALALTRAGESAGRIEIGYFLTRSGHGDELRYRSTLRDVFTLTTGGTRATLVGGAADNAFAYRRPRPGSPGVLIDERAGKRLARTRDAPDADHRRAQRASPAVIEGAGNDHAVVPAAPGLRARTRQRRPFPGYRGGPRRFRGTAGHDRPDRTRSYEMTASLMAWGATHAAAPDAALMPGVHGPVAALGLETLRHGAAESGLHEVAGPSSPIEVSA